MSEITRLWRHIFGEERGFLQVWTGKRVGDDIPDETIVSRFFSYPQAAQKAAEWALEKPEEGREVFFFCAHLLNKQRRKKANAAPVLSLWGDLDGAPVPNGRLKPTAIVESSPRRHHSYWRLDSAIPPEKAEELNKRLAQALEADPSGIDLTQVLRVPGTTNFKYEDRPGVRVVEISDTSHSPRELDELLSKIIEEPRASITEDEVFPEGSRNTALTKIAGTMRRGGMVEAEIRAALLEVNQGRCKPPLEKSEVARIAASISRYEPGEVIPPALNASSKVSSSKAEGESKTPPVTAVDLMNMEFDPTRWVVPDVLPEGLSLLAGKPKKGKSWMAMGLCEAVAVGGVALGIKRVEQGDTLYLALEDNHKRLKKRLKKVLDGRPAPKRMHLHTSWPRLDEGGAALLDEWLTDHPGARLVVTQNTPCIGM